MAMSRLLSVLALSLAGVLAACNVYDTDHSASHVRATSKIPPAILAAMDRIGTDRTAPVLIRAYKKDSELEIWKLTSSGQYALLKTYPVCRWSGQLGPKTREGDRQVPEGFYTVSPGQMNPNSAMWLSFNLGYPNALERARGFSGGDIMVHGTCSSRGCYAMTNEQIEEIYAVVRDAFQGGQKQVQFQSFPFRMTADNMARFRNDPNIGFWKNLKQGSDRFDVTKREVQIGYCGDHYVFSSTNQPSCAPNDNDEDSARVAEKTRADDEKAAALAASGTPSIRMQYADGDQHPFFRAPDKAVMLKKLADAGEFSRPEALAWVNELQIDTKGNVTTSNAYTEILKLAKDTLAATANIDMSGIQSLSSPLTATTTKTAAIDTSRQAPATQDSSHPAPNEQTSGFFLENLFSHAPPVVEDPDVRFPDAPPLPPKRG